MDYLIRVVNGQKYWSMDGEAWVPGEPPENNTAQIFDDSEFNRADDINLDYTQKMQKVLRTPGAKFAGPGIDLDVQVVNNKYYARASRNFLNRVRAAGVDVQHADNTTRSNFRHNNAVYIQSRNDVVRYAADQYNKGNYDPNSDTHAFIREHGLYNRMLALAKSQAIKSEKMYRSNTPEMSYVYKKIRDGMLARQQYEDAAPIRNAAANLTELDSPERKNFMKKMRGSIKRNHSPRSIIKSQRKKAIQDRYDAMELAEQEKSSQESKLQELKDRLRAKHGDKYDLLQRDKKAQDNASKKQRAKDEKEAFKQLEDAAKRNRERKEFIGELLTGLSKILNKNPLADLIRAGILMFMGKHPKIAAALLMMPALVGSVRTLVGIFKALRALAGFMSLVGTGIGGGVAKLALTKAGRTGIGVSNKILKSTNPKQTMRGVVRMKGAGRLSETEFKATKEALRVTPNWYKGITRAGVKLSNSSFGKAISNSWGALGKSKFVSAINSSKAVGTFGKFLHTPVTKLLGKAALPLDAILSAGGAIHAYQSTKGTKDEKRKAAMLNGGRSLAGMGTGAAIGAIVGSVFPVVGTAAGAAVGAAIGSTFGWMSSQLTKLSECSNKQLQEYKKTHPILGKIVSIIQAMFPWIRKKGKEDLEQDTKNRPGYNNYENRGLASPLQLTQKEFDERNKKLEKLKQQRAELVGTDTDEFTQEQKDKARDKFKKKKRDEFVKSYNKGKGLFDKTRINNKNELAEQYAEKEYQALVSGDTIAREQAALRTASITDAPTKKAKDTQYINWGSTDHSKMDAEFLKKLNAAAKQYHKDTGKKLNITSAYRSDQKQAELWARANYLGDKSIITPAKPRQATDVVINGKTYHVPGGGSSAHNLGRAIDMNAAQAKEFVKYAKAVGLRWGGDFSSGYDPVHFDNMTSTGASYSKDLLKKAGASPDVATSASSKPTTTASNGFADVLMKVINSTDNKADEKQNLIFSALDVSGSLGVWGITHLNNDGKMMVSK
jgi:hypothetical protein